MIPQILKCRYTASLILVSQFVASRPQNVCQVRDHINNGSLMMSVEIDGMERLDG